MCFRTRARARCVLGLVCSRARDILELGLGVF